ncbi:MAG: hypothetical protein AB1650_08765 [Candidatus Omnitrophota bacterium]
MKKAFLLILLEFILLGPAVYCQPASQTLHIELAEPLSNFFAERDQILRFHISGDIPDSANFFWSLEYRNGAVLERGQGRFHERQASTDVEISVPVPKVNEGVILPVDLKFVIEGPGHQTLAAYNHQCFIFSPDPFASNRQSLSELKIALYDPQNKTSALFDELGIPYDSVFNFEAIEQQETRLFIIGADIDLEHSQGLMETIEKLLLKNTSVLMLAPLGGDIRIPANTAGGFNQVLVAGNAIIHRLDKRLDTFWPPYGNTVASGVEINTISPDVIGRWSEGQKQWPWLEIDFANKTRFVVCGLDVVGKNSDGPAARYFLARLIEYMTEK